MKKYKSFGHFLKVHEDLRQTMSMQLLVAFVMLSAGISAYDIMNKAIFIIWTSFFTLLIPVIILRVWLIYKRF